MNLFKKRRRRKTNRRKPRPRTYQRRLAIEQLEERVVLAHAPLVVITHGFQFVTDDADDGPPDWVGEMETSIRDSFATIGVNPLFETLDWKADSGVRKLPQNLIGEHAEGLNSAADLLFAQVFGAIQNHVASDPHDRLDILMIGHSFGAAVNNLVVDRLEKLNDNTSFDFDAKVDLLQVVTLDPVAPRFPNNHDPLYPTKQPIVDRLENYYQTQGIFFGSERASLLVSTVNEIVSATPGVNPYISGGIATADALLKIEDIAQDSLVVFGQPIAGADLQVDLFHSKEIPFGSTKLFSAGNLKTLVGDILPMFLHQDVHEWYAATAAWGDFVLHTLYDHRAMAGEPVTGSESWPGDDHGQPVFAAGNDNASQAFTSIALSQNGTGSAIGRIDPIGDHDWFQFTPTTDGPFSISIVPLDSQLVPKVRLHWDNKILIKQDESGGNGNSAFVSYAGGEAGRTYFIDVSGAANTTGSYRVEVTEEYQSDVFDNEPPSQPSPDDFPNSKSLATTVSVGTDGDATVSGKIETVGDDDWIKFTVAKSGHLVIEIETPSSSLDTHLRLHNDSVLLSQNHSRIERPVTAGETYWLHVRAGSENGADDIAPGEDPTGGYVVKIRQPDTVPNGSITLLDVFPVPGIEVQLDGNGNGDSSGSIDDPADERWFQIDGASAGNMVVQVLPVNDDLKPFVTAYRADGGGIDTDTGEFDDEAKVGFEVADSEPIMVKVSSHNGRYTGGFTIHIEQPGTLPDDPEPDFGDTPRDLSSNITQEGDGSFTARIENPNDDDWFMLPVRGQGFMTIEVKTTDSALIPYLELNRDGTSGGFFETDDGRDGRAAVTFIPQDGVSTTFIPAEGESFVWAKVSSLDGTQGSYELVTWRTPNPDDDYPDGGGVFLNERRPAAGGQLFINGRIDHPKDSDNFHFRLDQPGPVAVQYIPLTEGFDPFFHRSRHHNDPNQFTGTSGANSGRGGRAFEILPDILPGPDDNWLVINSSLGDRSLVPAGDYVLHVRQPGSATDIDADTVGIEASPILLDGTGNGSLPGDPNGGPPPALDHAGDTDVFQVRAASDRPITFTVSGQDTFLRVYDASGRAIATDRNSGPGAASQITLDANRGDLYYLEVTAFNGTDIGTYSINVSQAIDDHPDVPIFQPKESQTNDATVIILDSSGLGQATGAIDVEYVEVPDDRDLDGTYDDFQDDSLDMHLWRSSESGNGSVEEADGVASLSAAADTSATTDSSAVLETRGFVVGDVSFDLTAVLGPANNLARVEVANQSSSIGIDLTRTPLGAIEATVAGVGYTELENLGLQAMTEGTTYHVEFRQAVADIEVLLDNTRIALFDGSLAAESVLRASANAEVVPAFDYFNDNSIDADKWSVTGEVREENGALRVVAREGGVGFGSNANTDNKSAGFPAGDPIYGFRTDFNFEAGSETQWGGGNMYLRMVAGGNSIQFEYNNDLGQMQVLASGIYGSGVVAVLSSKSGTAEVRQNGANVEILHNDAVVHTVSNVTLLDSFFEVRTDAAGGSSDKAVVIDNLHFYPAETPLANLDIDNVAGQFHFATKLEKSSFGDRDVFQVHATERGQFTVDVVTTDDQLDTFVRVYDSRGNLVAIDDDGGDGRNSSVTFNTFMDETYSIEVSGYGDNSVGAYEVQVQALPPAAIEKLGVFDDLNNGFDSANWSLQYTGSADQANLNVSGGKVTLEADGRGAPDDSTAVNLASRAYVKDGVSFDMSGQFGDHYNFGYAEVSNGSDSIRVQLNRYINDGSNVVVVSGSGYAELENIAPHDTTSVSFSENTVYNFRIENVGDEIHVYMDNTLLARFAGNIGDGSYFQARARSAQESTRYAFLTLDNVTGSFLIVDAQPFTIPATTYTTSGTYDSFEGTSLSTQRWQSDTSGSGSIQQTSGGLRVLALGAGASSDDNSAVVDSQGILEGNLQFDMSAELGTDSNSAFVELTNTEDFIRLNFDSDGAGGITMSVTSDGYSETENVGSQALDEGARRRFSITHTNTGFDVYRSEILRSFDNPTPGLDDRFGGSVAVLGGNLIVGSATWHSGNDAVGAAYLVDSVTGQVLQTFANPTPDDGDQFGISVAALGENVLVGSYLDDAQASQSGVVHLFDSSDGSLIHTFTNPSPDVDDQFGYSVAALGDNVLVGAFGEANHSGVVYLFDGSGQLLRTFSNPTPSADEAFGYSVAAFGEDVLVGSRRDNLSSAGAGAVYLFDGATGELLRTFSNPDPDADDFFGDKIAVVGGNVLVGAFGDDSGAENAGVAYLFDGSTGKLLHTFHNPTPAANDQFGIAVTAVGNNVLVGASKDDTGANNAGAAYLFDGTSGELLETYLNPTPTTDDQFAIAGASLDSHIVVGAPRNVVGNTDGGAVHLYLRPDRALDEATAVRLAQFDGTLAINSRLRMVASTDASSGGDERFTELEVQNIAGTFRLSTDRIQEPYDDFNDNELDFDRWKISGAVDEMDGVLKLHLFQSFQAVQGYATTADIPGGTNLRGFRLNFNRTTEPKNLGDWDIYTRLELTNGLDFIRIGNLHNQTYFVQTGGSYGNQTINLSVPSDQVPDGPFEVRERDGNIEVLHNNNVKLTIANQTVRAGSYFVFQTHGNPEGQGGINPAENFEASIDNLKFYVDHAPNEVAVAPALKATSDTGASNTDHVTNQLSLDFEWPAGPVGTEYQWREGELMADGTIAYGGWSDVQSETTAHVDLPHASVHVFSVRTLDDEGIVGDESSRAIVVDVAGPKVSQLSANSIADTTGDLESLTLTFAEPVDAASFTIDDIVSLTGPSGDLRSQISGIAVSGTEVTVSINAQNEAGNYQIVVGPNISDVAGNLLDQDQDGTAGESTEDQFTASVLFDDLVDVQQLLLAEGQSQRSDMRGIEVMFDRLVTIDSDAFVLQRAGAGGGTVDVSVATETVNNKTKATLTFSGSFAETGGSLVDGNYQLTVVGAKVRDAATNRQLDGNLDGTDGGDYILGTIAEHKLFRFFGDSDGDRDVDTLNFLHFRGTFGKTTGQTGFRPEFDLTSDGDVDTLDFLAFRNRFGQTLPFEAVPPPNAPSAPLAAASAPSPLFAAASTPVVAESQSAFVPVVPIDTKDSVSSGSAYQGSSFVASSAQVATMPEAPTAQVNTALLAEESSDLFQGERKTTLIDDADPEILPEEDVLDQVFKELGELDVEILGDGLE